MPEVDLIFLSRQMDQLLSDVANMRHSIAVLTAMVRRTDASLELLLAEMRAGNSRQAKLEKRGNGD
ncbi:MAG: hypothetical protein E5Y73_08465 [Mesorhizobium sp.]|uniref:hypothetical protein n=1 Tax=Mesorhizobium sp. TaxID=1871066 RepID=UPI0012115269|nr:hypothetical protein [Mesorhizobium sp.]TIL95156.1 MAG: hypothetical protein E5Y73_08465 [Mesorhizobium sp.]